jgi:hypothetical protein
MNLDDRHLIQQESFCVQQMLSNVIFVQYNMVKTFDHLVHHTWAKQMYFEIWKSKVSHNPKIVNVVFLPTMEI